MENLTRLKTMMAATTIMLEMMNARNAKHGELDQSCFVKNILDDKCGCKYYECNFDPKDSEDLFTSSETCPENHVKVRGTSICMKERDVCKKCPTYAPIAPANCI